MKKCTLPLVKYASQTSTKNNAAKQQSTAKRNAGCSEDPGFKTKAKNPTGADSHSVVAIIDICTSCLSTSTKQSLRAKHKYVQTKQERNIITSPGTPSFPGCSKSPATSNGALGKYQLYQNISWQVARLVLDEGYCRVLLVRQTQGRMVLGTRGA